MSETSFDTPSIGRLRFGLAAAIFGAFGLVLVAYYDPPIIQIWTGSALGAAVYLVRRNIIGRNRFARLTTASNRRTRVALIVIFLTGLWLFDLKLLVPETIPVFIGFTLACFLESSEGIVLHARRYRNDPLR